MKLFSVLSTLALSFMAVLSLMGCASVKVQKVPTPSQYVRWTDQMQSKADNLEGIRFYLPRPFVNVFESFPIRSDVYFASGVVSPDGKYVVINKFRSESELNGMMLTIEQNVKIPAKEITNPDPKLGLRGGAPDEKVPATADPGIPTGAEKPPEKPSTPAAGPTSPQSTATPQTGVNQRKMTNNNGAFAYQPLRGNFDLVYLPDFEEQYVVQSQAGLGNAQFEVNLGQGWSLQGFNSLTDNSEINRRIFDLIDSSIQAAKSIATSGASSVADAMKAGVTAKFAPRGGDVKTLEGTTPGTPVSMKVTIVYYAAKGLYPVIKPRELQARVTNGDGSSAYLDLTTTAPLIKTQGMDPKAIQERIAAVDNESRIYSVPRYPYQYISFNTFRFVAVEVIQPETPPFKHLPDKTGTQGERGDARAGEIVDLIKSLTPPPTLTTGKPGSSITDGSNVTARDSFIEDISVTRPVTFPEGSGKDQPHYVVSKINKPKFASAESKELTVNIEVVGKEAEIVVQGKATTRDAAKAALENSIKVRANEFKIEISQVFFTFPDDGGKQPEDKSKPVTNPDFFRKIRFPEGAADDKPHYQIDESGQTRTDSKGVLFVKLTAVPKDLAAPLGTLKETTDSLLKQAKEILKPEQIGSVTIENAADLKLK
jgi:hypothetical protein